MSNPANALVLGINLSTNTRELSYLRNSILLAIVTALTIIAVAGWFSARQAIRPVAAVTRTMEHVTATGLDTRIPAGQSAYEFERMIDVFNGMLDRLSKSFHQATRFSADAAHELKTPLTILQGHLEQALNEAETGSANQQHFSSLLEEVQRLKTIIRKLLILSRADTGDLLLNRKPVSFTDRVTSLCEDTRILAPDVTLECRVDPELWILADEELFQQSLQNLVNNAIKYNNKHKRIRLSLREKEGRLRLRLSNTSDGIPPESAAHIFERFYRVDPSRNRAVDGQGLGLSLVKEIIEAHGGSVVLSHNEQGWVAFDVIMPALHAAQSRNQG